MVHNTSERHPEKVFNEDLFLENSLQAGLPLNTVVSTDIFKKIYRDIRTIAVVPVSA